MGERKEYKPNTFCWTELLTTDGDGAKKFYATILGRELTDTPAGPHAVYTMATLNSRNVGAMYEMGKEQRKMNIPPHWQSYVSVEDVDNTITKAEELGAKVLVDASGAFYTKLFGWSAKTTEMGDGQSYTSFMNGDWPAGGMIEIRKEWGEVPPNWGVYFAVDDCDATCKKIQELGGKVDNPPTDIPEVGRFAVCADPQGAYFAVIYMTNPQD